MNKIQLFTTRISRDEIVKYLCSNGDFCGALIPPENKADVAFGNVFIERRGKLFFIMINRKAFAGAGKKQYITWQGLFDDFVLLLRNSPWSVAEHALTNYVTKSPNRHEYEICKQALDDIKYSHAYAVLGERVYLNQPVPVARKKNQKLVVETVGTKQLRLF